MASSDDIKYWFYREVYYPRLTKVVLYTTLFQLLLSPIAAFLLSVDIFHPLQWLTGVSNIFSFPTLCFNIVLTVITILTVLMHSAHLSMTPIVFSTVLELIKHFCSLWRPFLLLEYTLFGGIFSILYLRMSGNEHASFIKYCENDSTKFCINEHHVFIVFHSCLVGLFYGVSFCAFESRNLLFPIIQQHKFVQIKGAIMQTFVDSIKHVVSNVKWFVLTYAITGAFIQNALSDLFGISNESAFGMSLLYNAINANLLWCTFINATAVHLLFSMIPCLFSIFLTERYSFLIETPFENWKSHTLNKAIETVDCSLLRHLGFLDLSLLAQHSFTKRKEIFCLSEPGGHPHQWNAISTECLHLIKDFTNKLNVICEPLPITKREENIDVYSGSAVLHNSVTTKSPVFITAFINYLQFRFSELYSFVINFPLITIFIQESFVLKVGKLFAACRLQIWAVEALSFLVVASFIEDKYGVMQKDLPGIITSLLDLQQAMNRVEKMEITSVKRSIKCRLSSNNLQLKSSLKCAVKLALYKISSRFGQHLWSLTLSSIHQKQLQHYMDYEY